MLLLFFQSVARLLGIRATVRHAPLASVELQHASTVRSQASTAARAAAGLSHTQRARAAVDTAPRHTVSLTTAIA